MARVLYLDCFSGISGDMFLGACLDAGLPLEQVRSALGSLAVSGYRLDAARVLRCGISATHFTVRENARAGPEHGHHHHAHDHGHAHAHRSLAEIGALVDRSALSDTGKARVRSLFQRLAEAEAAIHQMPVEQVHLHEVGALDSIIDIVGAVYAIETLGIEQVICSPLNVGGGTVATAHGLLPVPAPATVRLLQGAPVYSGTVQNELVTPTGALIATSYAVRFGLMPAMTIERVGYGAGSRDNPGTPNVLRVVIGEAAVAAPADGVVVIECEIDDMNPQLFAAAMERLYDAGALDVSYTAVQMKKNRPGTRLTILAPPALRQALIDIVFRETTTLGVRHSEMARDVLRRDVVSVTTPFGPVRVKQAWHHGRVVNAAPEYDDCAALARAAGTSVKEVQAAALLAYGNRQERNNPS